MPASTAAHQLCFACHANAQEEDLKPFYNMASVRVCVFWFSYCCGNAHRKFPTLSNLPKQRSAEFSYVPLFTGANFGDEKPEKGSRGRTQGRTQRGWRQLSPGPAHKLKSSTLGADQPSSKEHRLWMWYSHIERQVPILPVLTAAE